MRQSVSYRIGVKMDGLAYVPTEERMIIYRIRPGRLSQYWLMAYPIWS